MKLFFVILAAVVGIAIVGYLGYVWYVNDVEQPEYGAVVQDGDFEIRDYPAMVMAEVTSSGDRRDAVSKGFRPLASYIFASEREGEKIAMTAPVIQTPEAEGAKTWSVRFIMPSEYNLDTLPKPAGADVRLVEAQAQRRAAVRFSGHPTDEAIAEQEARLRTWLQARNLEPSGPPTFAYYNAPFTPGFLRRNEVLFDLPNG